MTCRHFGECGGCSLQDVPYPEQLRRKTDRLQQLLTAALGRRAPSVLPMLGTPCYGGDTPWGFRHKVSFVFGPGAGGRGLVMGHFARESSRIIPVAECPVHSARGNAVAFAVRDRLARAGITGAGPRLDGIARHLVVRTTADERDAVVMLVVTRNDKRLRTPVRAACAGPDAPAGFLINVHDRPGPLMIGRETLVVEGRGVVRERRLGPSFLVSPAAFFQTNVEAAKLLVDEVLMAVPDTPARHVLDLYGGSGLFGLPLAQRGHTVTMVEENPQAVRDAASNQRLNRIPAARLRLVTARVEAALAAGTIGSGRRASAPATDAVILDPPRDGCAPGVIEGVVERIRPARVVYVSCNPEALARDLRAFVDAAYRIERVLPVDMFPHTDHIEAVVTLGIRDSGSGAPRTNLDTRASHR